eukprot:1145843-Pelagomonas_calceolata.AAC.6
MVLYSGHMGSFGFCGQHRSGGGEATHQYEQGARVEVGEATRHNKSKVQDWQAPGQTNEPHVSYAPHVTQRQQGCLLCYTQAHSSSSHRDPADQEHAFVGVGHTQVVS